MNEPHIVRGGIDRTILIGLCSVGVNLLLVGLKLGFALLSGSLSLWADAIHSMVDVFASLVVLAGLVIARRSSRSYPYGLYKVENLVSVSIALLIFLAAYQIVRETLLKPHDEVNNAPLALVVVALTALIAYLFSRFEQKVGEQTGSPSLIADSRHLRTDVLSSAVVFVALLGSQFGLPLDRVGAIVIVILIARAGWGLLVEGMQVLLDASISPETLSRVREVIASDPGVVQIKSLVGRDAGRYSFVEAELLLHTRDLQKAHQISQGIELAVRRGVPRVSRVSIRYEPAPKSVSRWAVALASADGTISPHFGEAPYFALIDVSMDGPRVVGTKLVANPHRDVQKQKGIKAAEFLVAQRIDGLVVSKDPEDKGYQFVLKSAGVEVVLSKAGTLSDLMQDLPVSGSPMSLQRQESTSHSP